MSIETRGIFPIETLEKILFYLDGKSLLRIRSVSSVWQEAIDDFITRFDSKSWKWLCFQTIPRNTLVNYLEVDVPSCLDQKIIERNNVDWTKLFKNHQNLHNTFKWGVAKKRCVNINLENDPVSCVKVTGNLFITGHFSGLICLWSADLGKMIDVYENAHTNQITDVVFGNIFGKDQYILAKDTDSSLDLIANHHFLISASLSGKVQARGMAISQKSPKTGEWLNGSGATWMLAEHKNPHVQVKLLRETLVIFSRENTINLWEVKKPRHYRKTPKFLPRICFRGPDHDPLFEGTLWPHHIWYGWRNFIVMTQSGKTLILKENIWRPARDQEITPGFTPVISRQEFDYDEHLPEESVEISKMFKISPSLPRKKYNQKIDLTQDVIWAKIFDDNLFVILNKKRQLLISTDGTDFSTYGPLKDFRKGHVTCVTYFANVFATGFSTGEVWLFFTKGPHDFHILDFDKPNVALKAGFDPITSLTLGLGLSKEETILIAGSEKVAFVFRV